MPSILISYYRDEVAFRWSGNRSLDENTTALTLRDFFQYYSLRSNVNTAIGLQNVPLIFKNSVKNHKTMPMEFFDMLIYYTEVCTALLFNLCLRHGTKYTQV